MSSILDIDLDYFNLIENLEQRLKDLLDWGDCPIAFIVEKHHKAYSRWKNRVKRGTLTQPSHILHVDEHHDMMDQKRNANIANFMYHAMRTWKNCRVHWMVDTPIDSPAVVTWGVNCYYYITSDAFVIISIIFLEFAVYSLQYLCNLRIVFISRMDVTQCSPVDPRIGSVIIFHATAPCIMLFHDI